MAGSKGVSFTASTAEPTVTTGTHQLGGSHYTPSVAELLSPSLAVRQPLPSREYQYRIDAVCNKCFSCVMRSLCCNMYVLEGSSLDHSPFKGVHCILADIIDA